MDENGAPAPGPMNVWQRLFGAITNPRTVFGDVAEHGGWGWAAVVLGVVNLVFVVPNLGKIRAFAALTLAHRLQPVPPAVQHVSMVVAPVTAVVDVTVGPLLVWLVVAFVIWIFTLFTGQRVIFRRLYAITVFAWVPATIGVILTNILIMMRPVSAVAATTVSLGAFFPANSAGILYRIAERVNPFGLWTIVLLAVGAAAALRTGSGKILTYLLALSAIVIVITAFATKGYGV